MAATNDQQPYGARQGCSSENLVPDVSYRRHIELQHARIRFTGFEFEKVLPENKSLGFRMINVNVDSPSSPTFPYQEMLFCFSILQPTKWVSYPVLYFTTQITTTSELTKTLSCKTMTDSEKNARKSTRRCASKTCKI